VEIKIRSFTFDDVMPLLEIINYYIVNTPNVYDYEARSYEFQKQLLEEKVAKNFPFLVAEIDNQIVGYGTYGDFRYKKGYQYTVEHSVYIHPDFLGKSIGKLLLDALIQIAKKQKIHTMIAVIDSENPVSIEMHLKKGFKSIGTIKEVAFKFDKWLDTHLLQLIID
jgi:L-amino acid N-acyltransferase